MTIEEEITTGHVPRVPNGVTPTLEDAKDKPKRGRGRPKSKKEFISKLPAPIRFDFGKHQVAEFFAYISSIPKDQLKETELIWYRYHPVVDMTEGGIKKKELDVMTGEMHPFVDEDWERQVLHRYGSGRYGCYFNENGYTIAQCLNIETLWDPDKFPPTMVNPAFLDPIHRQNLGYIDWLRRKGIKLPTEADKEREETEMQLGDTINKLTDTVIQQAARMNTPVPQINQQPSMSEKLSFEMASNAIDMFKEKAKVEMNANSQQNNGFELIDKFISVTDKINPKNNGESSDFMKFLMQQQTESQRAREAAEARNNELMMKLFTQRENPTVQPKSLLDQMREMAEMRQLMQQAFGGGGNEGGGEAEDKPGKESIPEILIKSAPTLLQHGVTMWGQLNQTMAYRTRMLELEALKATGQLPNGAQLVQQPQVQPMQAQQPQQQTAQQAAEQGASAVNPTTGAPFTEAELAAQREKQQKYAMYHGFIASIAQPLINHLNDPGHMEDGELVRKDGFDFASWFIDGNGRLMYDQVKTISPDDLMGAIESYQPLWQVISGAREKVKEFIGEFLTYDEMLADEKTEGTQPLTSD